MLAAILPFHEFQCFRHEMFNSGVALELGQRRHLRHQRASALVGVVLHVALIIQLYVFLAAEGLEVNLLNQRVQVVVKVKGDWQLFVRQKGWHPEVVVIFSDLQFEQEVVTD